MTLGLLPGGPSAQPTSSWGRAALGHDPSLLVPALQALNIYSLNPVISVQRFTFISTYFLLFGTGRDGGVKMDPFLRITYTPCIVCLV